MIPLWTAVDCACLHLIAAFKMLQAYTDNTQGRRKCKVEEAFEVTRPGDAFKGHAKLGNRKLLWHGTNVAVRASDGI